MGTEPGEAAPETQTVGGLTATLCRPDGSCPWPLAFQGPYADGGVRLQLEGPRPPPCYTAGATMQLRLTRAGSRTTINIP